MLTITSLLATASLIIVVLLGWLRWTHRRIIRVANTVPGIFPTRFPVLGHMPYTLFGGEKAVKLGFKRTMILLSEGLKTMCFWIGPFPKLVICNVDDIKKILTGSSTSEKGYDMKYLNYFMENGLLTAPGYIWKIKRRYFNPIFTPNNLEHLIPTFNQNSDELVSNLSIHVGQGPFDVMDEVMDTSLKTVCHLIFGPDVVIDMSTYQFKCFKEAIDWFTESFVLRKFRPWLLIDAVFELLYKKKLQEMRTTLDNFIDNHLKITKKRNEQKLVFQNAVGDAAEGNSKGMLNLVDIHGTLEESFPQCTESDLKADMATLLFTGADTIGATLSTCLLLLAQHQDVQERLYTEIMSAVDPSEDVTLENLRSLSYMDQVYKETLRLTILVPYVLRKATEDIQLSAGTIPAGYTLTVCIGAIHLNPKIYPKPLDFDPERFSSENMVGRERYTFLPFSGGPRNCIGIHYANMFIKVLLVHILRKYKLLTNGKDFHTMRKKLRISYVSAEGYNVMLEER